MGKLVLYLADGTTLDVPLNRERITIGRRADNDVCLPYPAVSGEHAAVVTILADSFLEDLGSTNGTLVNGKPAAKHFLRDHDHIDIGRQRMTYMSDDDARVEPLPADALHQQIRGLTDLVTPARLPPTVAADAGLRAPKASAASAPLLADLERHMAGGSADEPGKSPLSPESRGAPVPGTAGKAGAAAPDPIEARRGAAAPRDDAAAPMASSGTASPAAPEVPAGPVVRVLSGASSGRSMPMLRDELSVGRAGVQVALIRRVASGFRLIPVEGAQPPRINGAPVPADGAPLHPGDTFEVAGVRLELSLPA